MFLWANLEQAKKFNKNTGVTLQSNEEDDLEDLMRMTICFQGKHLHSQFQKISSKSAAQVSRYAWAEAT